MLLPVTADISAAAFIIACICSSVRPIAASCAITCKLCSSPISETVCNSLAKLRRLYTLSSLRYGLFLAAVCSAISALRWTWYAFSQSLSASTVFFTATATPATAPADATAPELIPFKLSAKPFPFLAPASNVLPAPSSLFFMSLRPLSSPLVSSLVSILTSPSAIVYLFNFPKKSSKASSGSLSSGCGRRQASYCFC